MKDKISAFVAELPAETRLVSPQAELPSEPQTFVKISVHDEFEDVTTGV